MSPQRLVSSPFFGAARQEGLTQPPGPASSYTRSWWQALWIWETSHRPLSYPQRVRRRACTARPTRLQKSPQRERQQSAPPSSPHPKPVPGPILSLGRTPCRSFRPYPGKVGAKRLGPCSNPDQKVLVVASAPRHIQVPALSPYWLAGQAS